jgi:hypothetical protein
MYTAIGTYYSFRSLSVVLVGFELPVKPIVVYIQFYLLMMGLDKPETYNAIPLQAWTSPEGPRSLRLPEFMIIGT